MRFVDLHNDAITNLSPDGFFRYIDNAKKAGVEIILVSVWTSEMKDPLHEIKRFRRIFDDALPIVQAKSDGSIKLLFHIEDAWFADGENVRELIKCKPASASLTWNEKNNLAGGAYSNVGLSPTGRIVVEELTTSGILIDLAHLNKPTFYDVAELLKKHNRKLLCTHACFDEVRPHPRNLDRRQIQTIVDSGGLIGLTLVGDFLTAKNRADFRDVYTHIAYYLDSFGGDNLGIGTDFFGTKKLPKNLAAYEDFERLGSFLLKKGLSQDTVEKLFFRNALSFFRSYNVL